MQYTHSSHSVYLLTYHFVFVVKYGCKVITDETGDAMKTYIAELCRKSECSLISAETDMDHIHLLVLMPPDMAPSALITILKSQTSQMVHTRYKSHVQNTCGEIPHSGAAAISLPRPELPFWKRSKNI